MLTLSNLKPKIKKKPRKRVGRGSSSGHGNYSGRGIKGQKARSGGGMRPGFEGGRMPLIRQIPKVRGFKSIHPKAQVVKLKDLEKRFDPESQVTPQALQKKGLITTLKLKVKVLGEGQLAKKLHFKNVLLSASAREAVKQAGGTISND